MRDEGWGGWTDVVFLCCMPPIPPHCSFSSSSHTSTNSITLPRAASEAASRENKPADWLYCLELLESTGIVVVPGSGFGQAEGSLHFRTTFLPPEEDIAGVVEKLGAFHEGFLQRYGGLEGSTGAGAGAAARLAPAGAAS